MFRFTAYDSDPALTKFLDNHTPVESLVTLKVGAQVMLLKNLNVSLIIVQQMLARCCRCQCYHSPRDSLQSGSKIRCISQRNLVATLHNVCVAQWIRHLTSNQGIAGSSPVADKSFWLST